MKKSVLIFAAILMMAGFQLNVMAQTSASRTTAAGAKLLLPMGLTQTSALHFGTMYVAIPADSGTCTLTTAGDREFSALLFGSSVGTPKSNAAYNVTGTQNCTYLLTVPSTITVTETVGSTATMIISALTVLFNGGTERSAVAATSTLTAGGTDSFIIGGKLTVKPNQLPGIYAGTFNVTVDYN